MSTDAMARANELMRAKYGDIPAACLAGARYLGSKSGVCGEVYMTAFAWYAQYVEKLACSDPAYRFTGDLGWVDAVEPHIRNTTKFEI